MKTRNASATKFLQRAGLLLSALLLTMTMRAQPLAGRPATPFGAGQGGGVELARGFSQPPDAAKPWVYWFWLNGNITRAGITADLEAMRRVGIGGVLIMEVDQGAPAGPVGFLSPEWRALFQHVVAEAQRLGLQVNMNNDAGWNGSGGPWVQPEQSMQKVVWSEADIEGPCQLDTMLSQPSAVAGYYRDIAVLAFPAPRTYRIGNIKVKACYTIGGVGAAAQTSLPPEMLIDRDRIADLSPQMDSDGRLTWDVPPGRWTVLRFGHTSTGVENAPAPATGRGLECDKLSKEGIEAHFGGMMRKLIGDVGPAAGKTLVATHIDSWENGAQNWTSRMRAEFQTRRGYDLLPFLPTFTGRVVGSLEVSERFLWDLRRTISDLIVENYAGRLRTLAHEHGLRLSIEAYGGPCDDIPYAGCADEPMCEFWVGGAAMHTCKEMASAAHTYGKPILGAEAFTATEEEKWREHPASIKALGDQAFCAGVNRLVFHRYALQPWRDREPGMAMGPWGLHYERTATWWEWTPSWHEYLARCQFLLRQGHFVADVCFLQPEAAPQGFVGHQREAYDYDNCPAEAVLTRMRVSDGRLVLPDGMSYRLLVLPQIRTMTPRLLGKIKELVAAGASILGPRLHASPSLVDYPNCDAQVRALSGELWGDGQPPAEIAARSHGKGRVFFSRRIEDETGGAQENANPLEQAQWIWHREGNPAVAAPVAKRYFRRTLTVPTGQDIASARVVMTADNAFELWINGRSAGSGEDLMRTYVMDVTSLLKPGANILAVAAENRRDRPNPAGLIGALTVRFRDGPTLRLNTDRTWETAVTANGNWTTAAVSAEGWAAAMELGPLGTPPWETMDAAVPLSFPHPDVVSKVLASMGVPPDFEADEHLRYIHRRTGDTDIFFVVNSENSYVAANCVFRVSGKTPQIWDPLTGRSKPQPLYWEKNGRTTIPLWLEPSGSLFIVFRGPTADTPSKADPVLTLHRNGASLLPEPGCSLAEPPPAELLVGQDTALSMLAWKPGRYAIRTLSGKTAAVEVADVPAPQEVAGPWAVRFQPEYGGPAEIVFDPLVDWTKHADDRVKYYAGTAVYSKAIDLPLGLLADNHRLYLDLGKVQVMAQVMLNGRSLGTLWKPPFRVDITDAAKPGGNTLQVRVVNLWPNRMIGDEQLPEDSQRNADGTLREWPRWLEEGKPSPTGRYTFTSWRLWKKDARLLESGLLGPVTLHVAAVRAVLDQQVSGARPSCDESKCHSRIR